MKPNNIVNLDKCLDYLQPTPYIVQSTDYMESGDIPVLTPGKTFILGYTKEKTGIFTNPLPVIIFDDFTTASKLVDFPFKVKSSAMKILLPKKDVDIKYIFYFLQVKKFPARTHKRYWISVCSKTNISLPLLSEQKRIVKKIEELFAVIDKNIQKLEHTQQALIQYRQSVLNLYFKKSRAPKQKIKMLCQVVRGGSPRPAGDLRFYNGPIPFLKVADLTHSSGKFITTAEHSIKPAGLVKTRQVPANTLLLSNSGATLGVPKICSFSTTFNDGIAAFLNLPPETLDYHYYFWCSKTQELRNINQGAAQPNLNTTIIENTEIPVPSLPEQKAIVEKIEKAFACADNAQAAISAALEQAKQLKQSILKRAFEGRLVPQDPNDKPVDLTQLTTKGKTK